MDIFQKNILSFNKQLTSAGLESQNLGKLKNKKSDGLIIVGMGGSGLAGEILKGVQKEIGINIPIIIWKDYGLPEQSFKNPLYVFVSFSGNTEETISGLEIILKNKNYKKKPAVITSGGKLAELAKKYNLPAVFLFSEDLTPHINLCGGLTPRQAVGKMFYAIIKILQTNGFRLKIHSSVGLRPENYQTFGRKLAFRLKNRLIIVYTAEKHKYLGYIWKIKLNETAKMPAFNNILPEMNHNEIVGFEKSPFHSAALFLVGDKINPRLRKKFYLTKKLLKRKKVLALELKLRGKNELEKTWKTMILADWTSYYLAKLNRVDPTETKIIDKLKKLMK